MTDESRVPPPPPSLPTTPPAAQLPPPPPGAAPFGYFYPQSPERSESNILAVLALIFSLLPFILFSQIAGLVLGIVHLRTRQTARRMARAAIVLSVVMVFVWALVLNAVFHPHKTTATSGVPIPSLPAVPLPSPVREGTIFVEDLRVGDCSTNSLDGGDINLMNIVPCSHRHRIEVFAVFNLPRGRYPGDATVHDLARGGCAQRFKGFIGRSVESTTLDWWSLRPLQQGWSENRSVQCLIYSKKPRTGSLRGSKK